MSGIVAMYSEQGRVSAEALERATRALAHRGSEERQIWTAPAGSGGLGYIGRGALGPDRVKPPLAGEGGAIRALVDGALYDRGRLAGALAARGHRLAESDSELVVQLYAEHGAAFVEHLHGEFAVVVYDAHRDLLIAARDRLGIRPLVYAEHAGALIVASEAKALLAAGAPAAWDTEAFLHACVLGGPLEDATMFAGVHRIPSGHLLIASRGRCRLVRYWDLDYPHETATSSVRCEDEDRCALLAALSDAVARRLESDAPVACYLGGLDASTVFGLACRAAGRPLHGFTHALGGSTTEENLLAHEMAMQVGALHTPIPLQPDRLALDLEQALYFAERPFSNISCALLFQLSRGVREAGFRIVLTGEGSDELFAGYPHLRRDLGLPATPGGGTGPSPAAPPQLGSPRGPRISIAAVATALGGFSPAWLHGLAFSARSVVGVLRPEYVARLVSGAPFASFASTLEVSRQLRGRHSLHQSLYLWSKSVFPNYILSASNDAMQMAHGVECRLPFLDHRVVEIATRLPVDRLIRGDVEKYLLREAARGVVTEAIRRRPKDRTVAPQVMAIEGAVLDELVQDTLRSPALAATPFFEPSSVVALLDSLPMRDPAARAACHPALMLALSVCLLQQRFAIGDTQDRANDGCRGDWRGSEPRDTELS